MVYISKKTHQKYQNILDFYIQFTFNKFLFTFLNEILLFIIISFIYIKIKWYAKKWIKAYLNVYSTLIFIFHANGCKNKSTLRWFNWLLIIL